MPYTAFFAKFPELAQRETRTLIAINDPQLPPGNYALHELYCDEPGCDCRRVFLNVFREQTGTFEAMIAYGWESREFYVKWMGDDDPLVLDSLLGPALNLTSQTTPLSNVLLDRVKTVLKDRLYVERLKRHYRMFREEIEREALRGELADAEEQTVASRLKVGRNDACPCSSGKKFKRCCGA